MPDLLIELFSEEIPARMQARAAEDLKRLVTNGLVEAGITYGSAAAFVTPRRLCLALGDMLAQSPATREERKGPRADAPEKALEGFLRSTGLTREALETRETPKGDVLFAVIEKDGRPATEIVAEVLEGAVRDFPWPKSMRWGSGSLRWVRPLHSILCIIVDDAGVQVVPFEVDGIVSGDQTRGHRFHAPDAFSVSSFDDYAAKLKAANVVLDAAERREAIWHDATNMAFASGLEVVEDAGLLSEVAGLVEWPVVLMGRIADDYLGLPAEVLQTSMKEHQKFFSVRNNASGQIERFITVANRETADEGATILAGNEKVLSARLADAKFFWENDLRVAKGAGMEAWVENLRNVTFHNKLGTQAELIDRMAALASEIAPLVGADAAEAALAAKLAKADLSSEMVYEFPELQGVMGRYYALAAGQSEAVADAARDHYAPLGPSDDVPTAPVSVAVSLAEKIDKLTGFWAIDEKPTGSKDPFALRRAALGVIRVVIENDISMQLDRHIDAQLLRNKAQSQGDLSQEPVLELVQEIAEHGVFGAAFRTIMERHGDVLSGTPFEKLQEQVPDKSQNLLAFLHDRLKVYLRDQGVRHDVIDACIAMEGNDDLNLLAKRAKALSDALRTDDGENLIQGFKRANNILSQAEEADGVEYSYGADVKFAETDEERALFAALDAAEAQIKPAMDAQDFAAAMTAMAGLRGPIDAFFDAVKINADNQTVRRNRLNLLSRIRQTCSSVADLTQVEG